MRRFVRENGLSPTTFGLFLFFVGGQSAAGWRVYDQEQQAHGESQVAYARYLRTGAFLESVFEYWESELLQMGAYVLLTAYLFQKGSPESKKLDEENPEDEDPRHAWDRPGVPGPVRRGGLALRLYEGSLMWAPFLLFFLSLTLHAAGGTAQYHEEQRDHGEEGVGILRFLSTAQFWFESLQNWRSEFLAVGALVVLSIVLRQRGLPESVPVVGSHAETGTGQLAAVRMPSQG